MIRNKQLKQPKLAKQKKLSQPAEQTFLEHVYELRKRLFWVVLSVIVASAIGLQYKDHLIAAVMAPLHGEKLVYLTPAGGFSFIFTLSIYVGLLLSIPVIVYHMYRFIEPLLGGTSKKFVATFIFLSIMLASAGAAFGYFVTIPAALAFLSTFAGDAVLPNLTAESYLSFVVTYILGLAVLFQVPLLLYLFDHVRRIPPGALARTQRFVIIAATVIAAAITPTPDAFNMMIVAIPLIVVYEIGVLAVTIRHKLTKPDIKKASEPVEQKMSSLAQTVVREAAPVTATVQASRQSAAQVSVPAALPKTQFVRTIDGMIAVKRPAVGIQVPSRGAEPTRLVRERRLTQQSPRTIDGLSII